MSKWLRCKEIERWSSRHEMRHQGFELKTYCTINSVGVIRLEHKAAWKREIKDLNRGNQPEQWTDLFRGRRRSSPSCRRAQKLQTQHDAEP